MLPRTDDGEAKIDIRELTWEDRERVLRLLFAKINSSQGQTFIDSAAMMHENKDNSSVFVTSRREF